MATNTTNYNLKKPAYTDTADIADVNGNMDKVDTALQGIGSGIAIISKGNIHPEILQERFVYVHNHSSLADGMYKAKSPISANATLSTSNLEAVSGGGLNSLLMRTATRYKDLGDINSQSELDTALDTEVAKALNLTKMQLRFVAKSNFGPFIINETYHADLEKSTSTTYAHAEIVHNASSDTISGYRISDGWHYEKLALESTYGRLANKRYLLSGGTTQSIQLGGWATYLVATYRNLWVVFTASSGSTPTVVALSNSFSNLTCDGQANASILLGNATSGAYAFTVTTLQT